MKKQTLLVIFNKICRSVFKHEIKYSKLVCEAQKAAMNLA